MTEKQQELKNYILHLADNVMILGQRNAEWCGHGPVLEQDIAITNISLDLIGEARNLYQYIAQIEGGDATEDDYPYKRDEREWKNALLVEMPNGHWGHTIIRNFLFDTYHYHYLETLQNSSDPELVGIAQKSIKEATYHLKYSSEWVKRLGDGTAESHDKVQEALNERIDYYEELFMPSEIESIMHKQGIAPDLADIKIKAREVLQTVCKQATLDIPEVQYPKKGGKSGIHTEYMGFILTELQYVQKSYPGCEW